MTVPKRLDQSILVTKEKKEEGLSSKLINIDF